MTSPTSNPPHPSFTALADIDWDDTTSILRGCTPLFDVLATDPELLSGLVARVRDDPHLAEMCEGYDFMHKLALHDTADLNVRLRLHVYQAGFFDRPHNHRWSFASHILRGGYVHRIFGRDDQFGEDTDPRDLLPIHERLEQPGCTYALHHTSVHTVQAEADTILSRPGFDGDIEHPEDSQSWRHHGSTRTSCVSERRVWRSMPGGTRPRRVGRSHGSPVSSVCTRRRCGCG